jgi:hypothetical protein
LRQRLSRLVRETLSFSKKLTHHIGAIKYFICHDNLTRAAALPLQRHFRKLTNLHMQNRGLTVAIGKRKRFLPCP